MGQVSRFTRKLPGLTAVGLIALVMTPVLWAAASTDTVTVSATELQHRADHYSDLEAFYRSRATPGAKHMITYFTQANRADRRAEHYRLAAAEAGHRG